MKQRDIPGSQWLPAASTILLLFFSIDRTFLEGTNQCILGVNIEALFYT